MPVLNQTPGGGGDPPYTKYYRIKPSDWVNNKVVIHEVEDLLPSSTGEVTWAPETVQNPNLPQILMCGIRLENQTTETLTLVCKTPPTEDVVIQVSIEEEA